MNPIKVETKLGLKTLGRLLRLWSLEPDKRPEHRPPNPDLPDHSMLADPDRIYVITREAFVKAMKDEGASENRDFKLREGVREIELLTRREDRVSFVFPEEKILMELLGQTKGTDVRVTTVELFEDEFSEATREKYRLNRPNEKNGPMHDLFLASDDPFDEFLDAYMAAYSVSQCR